VLALGLEVCSLMVLVLVFMIMVFEFYFRCFAYIRRSLLCSFYLVGLCSSCAEI